MGDVFQDSERPVVKAPRRGGFKARRKRRIRERGGIDSGPTDADVGESVLLHDLGVEEVAAIDDDGIAQGGVDALQVEGGELAPVGENEQGVGVAGGGIGILGKPQAAGRRGIWPQQAS